jgi:hypothetical protein
VLRRSPRPRRPGSSLSFFLAVSFLPETLLFLISSPSPSLTAIPHRSLPNLRQKYRTPECLSYGLAKALPVTQAEVLNGDTIVAPGHGGFGNQFMSFIRAIFLAYVFGYNRVGIWICRFCYPASFNSTDGIEIAISDRNGFKPVSINSYEADGSVECPLDDISITATIREETVKCLPKVSVNESALYICARGGEVFEEDTPFWWHGQPPCHYYVDAMKMDGMRETVVMSNHGQPSPCVERLLKMGATYGSVETTFHDLARFVHSKRIVVSRTSFTTAIMLLSKPKDVLYAFRSRYTMCPWPKGMYLTDNYERFGPHYRCMATEEYDDKVMREWHATEDQMAILLKSENSCVWEYK